MSAEQSKSDRKATLKAEAEARGISYEELKKEKKEKKAEKKKKKRSREVDKLCTEEDKQHEQEIKRLRSYSVDETEHQNTKRMRTRSMDLAEEEKKTDEPEPAPKKSSSAQTPEEWRKEHNITIKQHGSGKLDESITKPFFKFSDAPFCHEIQRALTGAGFDKPTPIQSQAWPIAIKNRDMISVAKTGSGKTCGFLLPSIHQYAEKNKGKNHYSRGPRAAFLLILAPTRELAVQISEESNKFARHVHLKAVCLYGGAPKYPQISTLSRGVDIIIATPGRLNDLIEMNKVNLASIKFLVLDEADRMLDMGFEPQIRSVISKLSLDRQTLLFSATWPKEIQKLAHDFLKKDTVQINVGDVDSLVANKDITQKIHMISEYDKPDKIQEVLKELTQDDANAKDGGKEHPKIIVFTSRKSTCDELANKLWDDGFAVDSLHGDRAQWERTKVMNAFKSGTLRMLIATDVAARGLDVKDVGVVINYDMPAGQNGIEDYVHRIGRTGRAGKKGDAITFFTEQDSKRARELVELLDGAGQEVPAALRAKVRPAFRGFGGRGGRGGRGRGGFGRGGRGRGGRGRGGWGR